FRRPFERDDRRLGDLVGRLGPDRPLMLCVEVDGELRGGVLATGDELVGVRAIGIDLELRGLGVGRRLLEAVEVEALVRGAREIVLGAAVEARGFYTRLGYTGKHAMRLKQLPLPGRVREHRTAKLAAAVGDLEAGVVVGTV